MEAVPRLPMLSFELRTNVENVGFGEKLKQYIRSHYDEDPVLYARGITGIEWMRSEAVYPSKSIEGCALLKRYYCQLHFMASRFPMRENGEASVQFSWKSLHSNATISLQDISLEMASILYNVGALHSQLGAMDNRTTSEGMKMSCSHFQCAAWAFQHVKEEFPQCKNFGLSPVFLSFLYHLCLAQAQECILEKSMMDNRNAAITAKVAIQVVDYYKHSLKLLKDWPQDESNPSDIFGLKIFKKWEKYVTFKISYYESLSLLFQGRQSEDLKKMGERVSYFQAAYDKLEEARKLPLGINETDNVTEALNFVYDVIKAKRDAAKNENEFIYHEDVPNITYLPKIKGASLVKGIPFSINDPEVCGTDLFTNIIPMKAHEYSSLYSEEKAKLMRRINGLIENKDEELETFLSMLDLDEIKSKMDGNKLPQELVDRCAALNAKTDAIQNLTEAMNKLADIYQDVESMLTEIQEMLNEEENHEKEYQLMVGKRPPSIAATDLTREAKKYQEAHSKASESNQTLHKAMVMHISNLKLLSLPLKELINQIPTVTESSEVEAVTKEMLHLISKVEEMKQQRLMLAGQLRDIASQDDITRKIIVYSGDKIEDLFAEELKKYEKCVSLIEQNLAAQENILRAMKESYARYGATRKNSGELHRRRTAMISSLIASHDAYEDLISKSSKGLDFYKKLETNVSKLLQRVKGTCKVQDEEREQMLKSVKKPDFGISQSDSQPSIPLKLKDYLNIVKETGKLTLEHPNIVPPTTFYNDAILPQQSWKPGIRPAPVGSEETDTNIKNSTDSFRGFYQDQGKDQVWANTYYSQPQSADQKLKYYMPPNSSYQNYTQTPNTPNQDLYPISSYSTSLPKTEGQGYEPKSNYYDVQTSPNRCYNPTQSFNEALNSSSTNNMTIYSAPEVSYSQIPTSTVYSQTNELPSQFGYSSQVPQPYCQNSASQQSLAGYVATNEPVEYNASVTNQIFPNQLYSPSAYSQNPPFNPSDPSSVSYGTHVYNSAVPSSTQNSLPAVQPSAVYDSCASDQPSISNFPTNYNPVNSASLPYNYATPQDQIPNYPGVQTYQPSAHSENQIPNYVGPSQVTYNCTAPINAYFPQNSEAASKPYVHPSSNLDSSQTSWQGPYTTNTGQYFQSGNESLYTASQTPNNYTMTNSDVCKTEDVAGESYTVNPNYGNQYYVNQYGGYGQADIPAQSGNPVTYIQAGTVKQQAVTTTTFSNFEAKSSSVTNPSNVDLLAGLDFNINHSPLLPETLKKEEQSMEAAKKPKSPPKSTSENSFILNSTKEPSEEKPHSKDMVGNLENFSSFVQEVEKYEKFVEGLTLKTLNGPTSLDLKWKEIVDFQEKISSQHIISVARCYPMKNRFPDILPYDDSRVELPSTKDDYINASKMMSLTKLTPSFILTQAPLPSTYGDFWAMVFEQQVEIVVCLLSDSELDGHIYWPSEKGQELEMGKLKISLQSSNIRSHWVERILSICAMETRITRVVVHLQYTSWPGSSFPDSPGPFLSFVTECINFFTQQRSHNHPVVVHCISGVGRTGLFCLIIASLLDIQAGKGIPDLANLAGRMSQFRKSCLRDREHLKFGYQAVLYYSQNFLMKHGILTSRPSFEDKKSKDGKCHTRHPSEDFLVSPAIDVGQVQSGVERLEIDGRGKKLELEGKVRGGRSQSVCSSVSCTSSGRSSPSSLPPDILSSLDSANFSLKIDPSEKKKKRFTPENFNKGSIIDTSNSSSDDPLNRLDPLWTIKK